MAKVQYNIDADITEISSEGSDEEVAALAWTYARQGSTLDVTTTGNVAGVMNEIGGGAGYIATIIRQLATFSYTGITEGDPVWPATVNITLDADSSNFAVYSASFSDLETYWTDSFSGDALTVALVSGTTYEVTLTSGMIADVVAGNPIYIVIAEAAHDVADEVPEDNTNVVAISNIHLNLKAGYRKIFVNTI